MFRKRPLILIFLTLAGLCSLPVSLSQTVEPDYTHIRQLVQSFKKNPRGPYRGIRWFCPDGSILPAKQRCAEPGGIQHALVKDEVKALQEDHHLFLGQILAGTPFEDFWDGENQNSRAKQYQLEQFLRRADNGWVLRRAQYYRGAFQAEDEARWAENFLLWLLSDDALLQKQFFLLRQLTRTLPRSGINDKAASIRALSKEIADSLPAFMDIRIKIHGQPDSGDIGRVEKFIAGNKNTIPPEITNKLTALNEALKQFYRIPAAERLKKYREKLSASAVSFQINHLSNWDSLPRANRIKELSAILLEIRKQIISEKNTPLRLLLMDFSVELENLLFRSVGGWQPATTRELLTMGYLLAKASAGCGYLEPWEWESIEPYLKVEAADEKIPLEALVIKANFSRRSVEWGVAMMNAVYDPVVRLFSNFEPLSGGFIDDQIRASILLPQGEVASQLSNLKNRYSGLSNQVLDLDNQGQIRGLNPGYALGKLEVITGSPDGVIVSKDNIYVLQRAPQDLQPVAGIATVMEGNIVSHVQLLARNLGIPNAVLSLKNLLDLSAYSGLEVFYAVSGMGRVILKPAAEMTAEEQALFNLQKMKQEKMTVPTGKIDLHRDEILDLRKIRAYHSGIICGPKAANLGELRFLFPDKVAPALIIPFGAFKKHLDQPMPGTDKSYWQYLQNIFQRGKNMAASKYGTVRPEKDVFKEITRFHDALRNINFLPEFEESLNKKFAEVFAAYMGQVPVFIRSDTNMEDLTDFTGAGLNLTIPNILDKEELLQAIREVWASPFSQRSFRWRQRILTHPLRVYPSVLILQGVAVEKSGVMITTGVMSGEEQDITAAFNRGVGGAVGGQAAESYLLRRNGADILISPSRESSANYLLPRGGLQNKTTYFDNPILSAAERGQLRKIAGELQERLSGSSKANLAGPYDVELGFLKNKIWLFQVRPFVENRKAQSSAYLKKLDPQIPEGVMVDLSEKL